MPEEARACAYGSTARCEVSFWDLQGCYVATDETGQIMDFIKDAIKSVCAGWLAGVLVGAVIAFAVYNPTLFEVILKALLLIGLGLGSGLTVFYGLVLPMLEEHFK